MFWISSWLGFLGIISHLYVSKKSVNEYNVCMLMITYIVCEILKVTIKTRIIILFIRNFFRSYGCPFKLGMFRWYTNDIQIIFELISTNIATIKLYSHTYVYLTSWYLYQYTQRQSNDIKTTYYCWQNNDTFLY